MQHHDPHHNRDESIHGNHAPIQLMRVAFSDRTLSIVALVIAAILVLGMFGLYNRYFVLKMNYDDLKAAMLLHGIDPHPHLPTESP